jgi:hypothetical protein
VRLPLSLSLSILAVLPCLGYATSAAAYCRTTTCPTPAGFVPSPGLCEPPSLTSCTIGGATVKNRALWWHSPCVGYSMQRAASRNVTPAAATSAAGRAFAAWSSASCPGAPTISARDLGPVDCATATFNVDGANQNVIVFHDDAWPHPGGAQTIALTTVSFNRDTGEILDADIELNSSAHTIALTDAPGKGIYDLESVLTHEAGHFLGLAHTPDATAVMYYEDEGGSARHRALTPDDNAAICVVYPPNGLRPVDGRVSATGTVAASACDPTPRNGFSTACNSPPLGQTTNGGCSVTAGPGDVAYGSYALLAAVAIVTASACRRGARGRP